MVTGNPGRHVHIAIEIDGRGTDPLDPSVVREVVQAAEAGGFTFVTIDDGPLPPDSGSRLDAVDRAAYVSTLTERIGLAPTAHVTTTEPFHLAAQIASLDHLTHGRAAWVVGADNSSDALATIGTSPLGRAGWLREVGDVVEVARQLWDSWQDDAVIKDVATGRYLDPNRVHHVDFEGATFSVKGPLITPRPPQGQPVVIAPASLAAAARPDIVLVDRELDADFGDALVFTNLPVTADLAERVRQLAGHVDGIRLLPTDLVAELPLLVERVLPVLRAEGLHRPPEAGATLRATLGLPRPANRFVTTSR